MADDKNPIKFVDKTGREKPKIFFDLVGAAGYKTKDLVNRKREVVKDIYSRLQENKLSLEGYDTDTLMRSVQDYASASKIELPRLKSEEPIREVPKETEESLIEIDETPVNDITDELDQMVNKITLDRAVDEMVSKPEQPTVNNLSREPIVIKEPEPSKHEIEDVPYANIEPTMLPPADVEPPKSEYVPSSDPVVPKVESKAITPSQVSAKTYKAKAEVPENYDLAAELKRTMEIVSEKLQDERAKSSIAVEGTKAFFGRSRRIPIHTILNDLSDPQAFIAREMTDVEELWEQLEDWRIGLVEKKDGKYSLARFEDFFGENRNYAEAKQLVQSIRFPVRRQISDIAQIDFEKGLGQILSLNSLIEIRRNELEQAKNEAYKKMRSIEDQKSAVKQKIAENIGAVLSTADNFGFWSKHYGEDVRETIVKFKSGEDYNYKKLHNALVDLMKRAQNTHEKKKYKKGDKTGDLVQKLIDQAEITRMTVLDIVDNKEHQKAVKFYEHASETLQKYDSLPADLLYQLAAKARFMSQIKPDDLKEFKGALEQLVDGAIEKLRDSENSLDQKSATVLEGLKTRESYANTMGFVELSYLPRGVKVDGKTVETGILPTSLEARAVLVIKDSFPKPYEQRLATISDLGEIENGAQQYLNAAVVWRDPFGKEAYGAEGA